MKIKEIVVLALTASLLCSCGTYKRLGYLQDTQIEASYSVPDRPQAKIAKDDELAIVVSCASPVLAAPFNVVSGVYSLNADTREESLDIAPTNAPKYPVSESGDIVFPVLGTLHVEGLTLKQVKDLIEGELIRRSYIKEPVVTVEFANFQITVLGEVNSVGIVNISNGSVNIFELLAMSGDLTMDAKRDDIWVIRTTPGRRQTYSINLKSKDCYYSPVFYLQQNDMVYVPPKDNKMDNAASNTKSWIESVLSFISTIVTTMLWVTIYTR